MEIIKRDHAPMCKGKRGKCKNIAQYLIHLDLLRDNLYDVSAINLWLFNIDFRRIPRVNRRNNNIRNDFDDLFCKTCLINREKEERYNFIFHSPMYDDMRLADRKAHMEEFPNIEYPHTRFSRFSQKLHTMALEDTNKYLKLLKHYIKSL
jgi:hypothetical protein